ncbi:MAG: response regulator transcription factor [Planctomycetaceae bacterium]|jgi:DNA-binding NarL/FixJ family response regulator|nr:response regulator transcription factor [Planctomycetaceae bacterium]
MIRVFLADEQPVLLAGLRSFFSGTEFLIVGEVTNGLDLVQGIGRTYPHLVLVDTNQNSFQGFSENFLNNNGTKQLRWEFKVIEYSATLKFATKSYFLEEIRRIFFKGKRYRSQKTNSLTYRETEILGLIVQGFCNKEIARSLGISLDTVKEHVQNILRKTSLSDRTQAALWAVRHEIVSL